MCRSPAWSVLVSRHACTTEQAMLALLVISVHFSGFATMFWLTLVGFVILLVSISITAYCCYCQDLDLAKLGNAFGVLRLPKMPEVKKAKGLEAFVPSKVDPDSVKFRDKQREKQRQQVSHPCWFDINTQLLHARIVCCVCVVVWCWLGTAIAGSCR